MNKNLYSLREAPGVERKSVGAQLTPAVRNAPPQSINPNFLIFGEFTGENRRTTCNKKIGSKIFIVGKFCKKCTCKIGRFKIKKHVYI
jgi:hypothetical protein